MIIREKIATPLTDSFVKVVVDIQKRILAMGCEFHIDCAEELLGDGSRGRDLWGANAYPETSTIEFVSLINIRPNDNNRTMEIQLPEIRNQVEEIIRALVL